MVTFTGRIDGRPVTAEIHGPHDARGDSELLAAAAYLIRQKVPVQFGPPLGGGAASFEEPLIALTTLAAVGDLGTASFDGPELEELLAVPDGADA